MVIKTHFELMATYNAVMNQKICDHIKSLSKQDLWLDKKAFFGSIMGTLNHIMVGDLIWLCRFNCHSSYPNGFDALQPLVDVLRPTALTQTLYHSKSDFISNRQALDNTIIQFIEETNDSDYAVALLYTNTKGITHQKSFSMLLQHFFNHQTHHRGQITTLLSQMHIDIGETDLLMLITDF